MPGDLVDGSLREPAAARRAAVVSVPQADRVYRLGESILIDVQFDTGVTVSGAPRLELAIDDAGNAAEMVSDCYDDDGGDCARRVVRGGSWSARPEIVRSAYRSWCDPTLRNLHNGFRVARTLP